MNEFDSLVDLHLNLQVKISYRDHHDFLLRHGLKDCSRILDVGTGNGTFVERLAEDHPQIQFTGIDKRKHCIDSALKLSTKNLSFTQLDMFARESAFDFSAFDGFFMRYFLLHVDNSQKILDLFRSKSKKPSRFWMIDLDWSQFSCTPEHPAFEKLTRLVKDFCSKISIDSRGGQRIVPMLEKSGYQNIKVENIPFSKKTIPLDELALYLRQEVICYSLMSGKGANDPETGEIVRFIDEDFRSGGFEISYGMILVYAELNP